MLDRVLPWSRGRNVVLVFDGLADPGAPRFYGSLQVRWSGSRKADDLIAAIVGGAKRATDWRVVTDDRALSARCRQHGAAIVRVAKVASKLEAAAAPAAPPEEQRVDVEDWLRWFEQHGKGESR